MKGLVLAGGSGSRLRPITHTLPKQLVPVANKPVLDYVIENLKNAGIREIGIILGGDHPDQIQSYLGDGDRHGVDLTYIYQGEPLGLAHAVGCAREFIGDSPFVVYFGDTLVDGEITKQLVESFNSAEHDAGLVLQEVTQPSRYGISEFDGDELVGLREKPDKPPSNLAYVGVLALTPLAFDVIEEQEPSWRGELELTETVDRLITRGNGVQWVTNDGLWKDVGTPADVIDSNKEMIDRRIAREDQLRDEVVADRVIVGADTTIDADAEVRGPVILGNHVEIGPEVSIGPYTSIGDECVIKSAHIESSVLMDGCVVDCDRSFSRSIVAANTNLERSNDGDVRAVLGQNTSVSL